MSVVGQATAASTRIEATEPKVDISVVLPIRDERSNLVPLLQELSAVLLNMQRSHEIVAVDDGSVDGSRALLEELALTRADLHVVLLRGPYGQSAAFDAGFRQARGKIVVTMDADLQNDPNDIPALVKKLEQGYDLVSGWRRPRQDDLLQKRLPSLAANALIRTVTGTRVHDVGCSLRAYRGALTQRLHLRGQMHRFMVPLAEAQGARVAEVVVHHRARTGGRTKYGLARTLVVLRDVLSFWRLNTASGGPSTAPPLDYEVERVLGGDRQ